MPIEGGVGRRLQDEEGAGDESGAAWAEEEDTIASTDNARDETERREEYFRQYGTWPGDPGDGVDDL